MQQDVGARLSITESAAHHAVIEADPVALAMALNTVSGPRDVAFDAWGDAFEPLDLLWSVPHDDVAPVLECLDILVRAGATSKTRAGAFREIIFRTAPVDVIAAFLEKTDCDPNSSLTYSTVFTPLMSAVSHHTDPYGVSLALLQAGADPNAVSTHAQVAHFITPTLALHEAIVRCRRDVVDLLLAAGADPFATDRRTDMRAVHWARHVVAARETAASLGIVALFEGIEAARRRHDAAWPDLKKDLMEAAWHPSRLAKLGVFDEIISS
jgi:hypothetical protein